MDRQKCSKNDTQRISLMNIIECVKFIPIIVLIIILSPVLFLVAFVFGSAIQKASEIPEDLYEQRKPWQSIESGSEEEKEEYVRYICHCASERIKHKALSKDSVHGYIRHLPIKGEPGFDAWGEEVLDISDKCLHELYEYSKEMRFISKDCSFTSFCHRKF